MNLRIDYHEIESRVLAFFRKLTASFRAFLNGLESAVENYLRSKTRHMPAVLPKGRRATIEAIFDRRETQEFLHEYARESGIALDHVETTFRNDLAEISSDLNYLTTPFWDALLTWVFQTVYEGFELDTESLERIRAATGKNPLLFVSNHRSHMDYMLLSYVFYRHQIPLPHVCAGANLSFWPLGPIFRKSGGFFIRRSYEGTRLYAAAIQSYLEELIRNKVNVEFFIEGTRSRTGKLLPPRMGILNALVQAYSNGAADEIVMVPTSITYESILEEKSYLDEQAGASKKEEGFWDLFRLRKYLRKKKGKVYLQFGEPISMKEFFHEAPQGEKREFIRKLAYELTYGINKSTVVTPASLVATALLTHSGRAISDRSLEEKIDRYLDYLRFKQCHLSEPLQKYQRNAIRESLKNYVKDHLVEEYIEDGGSLFAVREERRPLLDYYKNSSLHFFVSMGVLATLLQSSESQEVPFRKIEEDYIFLQDLFQFEFTFSRRQSLRSHLEKAIGFLEKKEMVRFDGDLLRLTPNAKERLTLFSSPIRNFLEAYFILWKSLPLLGARRWESKELVKYLQQRGRILYLKEEVSHSGVINKFTLLNALSVFREMGMILEKKEGWGKKQKIFYTVLSKGEAVGRKLHEMLKDD